MKICIFAFNYFMDHIIKSLEKDGHIVFYLQFNKDADIILVQNHVEYLIYGYLKRIKKNNIKLINIITDIPVWRLEKDYYENTLAKYFKQSCFNASQKNYFLRYILYHSIENSNRGKIHLLFSNLMNQYFNNLYYNRVQYQINYKRYLKHADLNLSISRFTKKTIKKLLKVDSKVFVNFKIYKKNYQEIIKS